jgi:hypothetical protein
VKNNHTQNITHSPVGQLKLAIEVLLNQFDVRASYSTLIPQMAGLFRQSIKSSDYSLILRVCLKKWFSIAGTEEFIQMCGPGRLKVLLDRHHRAGCAGDAIG